MSVSGDLRVSATTLGHYSTNPPLCSSLPPSKVEFSSFPNCKSVSYDTIIKLPMLDITSTRCHSKRPEIFGDYKLSSSSFTHDLEPFLHNAVNMNFLERLNLAWKILFPFATTIRNSNAKIAKQRLKMILFSDRCDVSDEAKHKIVSNVVSALSDFVVIESKDKVQLSVSTDPDHGTIYSVIVPVRRVRQEYQDVDNPTGSSITNIKYKDTGETAGSVDVKFDFYIQNEEFKDLSM